MGVLTLGLACVVVGPHQDDAGDVVLEELERDLLAEVVELVAGGGEVDRDLRGGVGESRQTKSSRPVLDRSGRNAAAGESNSASCRVGTPP